MDLKDYPRPPKDTGIGMHWTPGNSGAVGAGELRKTWIPQLQRMGVKWVKLLHSGGLLLAEMLLDADIMPVVRIYRHRPNVVDLRKAVLGREEIEQLKEFIAIGVKYFEFNNEPELSSEWEKGALPGERAIDYVARAAIVDMETILGLGGYPAVPAVAIGTQWDLIGKIIEHGGDYLFDEPVWLAIHNYDINHPLDYPYDRVNRFGELLTPEEYRSMGTDAWTGAQWGTRTLAFINERRNESKNPKADIIKDASCFLAYERFAALSMKHLGRHLPIISTENGPIVGEDPDPRYPTTTPESHAQKVVDIAEIMMGVSKHYDPAPDYYFATAFWLMGASILRAKGWEGHAWFSPFRPGGRLPAVDALEKLPKRPRQFDFDDDGGGVIPPVADTAHSVVSGVIHGYPHMRVILRSAGYVVDSYTNEQGRFRIEKLPAGSYRLSVPGADIVRLGIELDGENQVTIEIGEPESAPPPSTSESGWRALVEDVGPSSGLSSIRVSVEGKTRLPVRISADGWDGYTRETGSKPEFGPYALEFSPLGPGEYLIEPEGLGISPRVRIGSKQILHVTFRPVETSDDAPHHSRISGRITHGAGLRVFLLHDNILIGEMITDDEGAFTFEDLPAGLYRLQIPDLEHVQEIELDGDNDVTVNLEAPDIEIPHYSTISGRVLHGAGRKVILKGPGGERTTEVGQDERYQFDHLGPGQYYVRVLDTLLRRGGLKMTGRNHREVNFALPVVMPAGSVIYGQVPQGVGWQLYVRGPKGREIVQPLDEKGRFEVSGLEAGEYELILQGDDADFIEHVEVDGTNRVKVEFDAIAATPKSPSDEMASDGGDAPDKEQRSEFNAQPKAWTWKVEDIGATPGFGVIRVRIPGRTGLPVRIWADEWDGMVRIIGDKPEYGDDVCEFAPLGAGKYYLQPADLSEAISVEMPGGHEVWVTFTTGDDDHPAHELSADSGDTESIRLYILVKSPPQDQVALIHTLRFAAHTGAVIGDDLSEALRAETVLVLASPDDFDAQAMARLRSAGSQVIRVLPTEYATRLQQLSLEFASRP